MPNKTIASLVAIIIMMSAATFTVVDLSAGSVSAVTSGDYDYQLINNNTAVEITGYNGLGGSIVIPSEIDNLPTLIIGDNAFNGCTSLTAMTIPTTVSDIGSRSFYDCSSLRSLTLPTSIIDIGDAAFSGCSLLSSVALPSGVNSIGDSAFFNCTHLSTVAIPSSVDSIGYAAFAYCPALTAIDVDQNNQEYATVDGALYNKTVTELIQCPGDTTGTFVVPGGVTNIGHVAFGGCTSLTAVTIPENVSVIGSYAFLGCDGLGKVDIKGANSIGSYAFSGCSALVSIMIPSSTDQIGDYAFAYCKALTAIVFNGDAPSVGDYWTYECDPALTVYYHQGATGFSAPSWNVNPILALGSAGRPVTMISPISDGHYNTSNINMVWTTSNLTSEIVSTQFSFDGQTWMDVSGTSYLLTSIPDGTYMLNLRVTDMAGNTNGTFVSFTVDTIPPTVVNHSANGDDVASLTGISVSFSEAMNESSVGALIDGVNGTCSWSGNVLTIDRSSALPYDSAHTVEVSGKDLAGNHVDYSWSFTTMKDEGAIEGVVKDREGNPIVGGTVGLGDGRTAVTDSDGHFSFTNVTSGPYNLTFTKIGYATTTIPVSTSAGQLSNLGPVTVQANAENLDKTLVVVALIAVFALVCVGGIVWFKRQNK
jgi:BspA type Leucine rich repeat region (6 copies)/Carboxypeptidase regulatory-like domain/Bacterial Ig-like domain